MTQKELLVLYIIRTPPLFRYTSRSPLEIHCILSLAIAILVNTFPISKFFYLSDTPPNPALKLFPSRNKYLQPPYQGHQQLLPPCLEPLLIFDLRNGQRRAPANMQGHPRRGHRKGPLGRGGRGPVDAEDQTTCDRTFGQR